jgi:uncharacterized surface protein with fasciclin (FAS1) repeats
MKKITALSLALIALAAPMAMASGPAARPAGGKNLVQTAVAAGQFTTLVKLVKLAGLQSALEGSAKLTVFAPTNAAFAKVPKSTLDALLANKAKLKAVLLYHVLKGEVPAAKVITLKSAKTLEGSTVKIRVSGGVVYVNQAKVLKTNVFASNGVIHVINSVLVPTN